MNAVASGLSPNGRWVFAIKPARSALDKNERVNFKPGQTCASGILVANRGFAVVTTNARDFIELLDVDVHPGLIVLRESGLSREEQWDRRERCRRTEEHVVPSLATN